MDNMNSGEDDGEDNGTKIDVRALALSLQSAETVEDMEEILKDKGELPLQVYSSIIRGFGRDKRMDSAWSLLNWMKRKKVETHGSFYPNCFIYNSLLGAVKQSEQFSEMETIMNEMAQEGITPDVVTCNTLMAIYLEKGEGDKALNILEEIRKLSNNMLKLLNDMDNARIPPGRAKLERLVWACTCEDHYTVAKELLNVKAFE